MQFRLTSLDPWTMVISVYALAAGCAIYRAMTGRGEAWDPYLIISRKWRSTGQL